MGKLMKVFVTFDRFWSAFCPFSIQKKNIEIHYAKDQILNIAHTLRAKWESQSHVKFIHVIVIDINSPEVLVIYPRAMIISPRVHLVSLPYRKQFHKLKLMSAHFRNWSWIEIEKNKRWNNAMRNWVRKSFRQQTWNQTRFSIDALLCRATSDKNQEQSLISIFAARRQNKYSNKIRHSHFNS